MKERMIRNACCYTACLLAAILWCGKGAYAQESQIKGFKDLPSYMKEANLAEFEKATELIEEKPRGDRFLEFEVRIPKNWKRVGERIDDSDVNNGGDVKLSRRILGRLVKYYGAGTFAAPSHFDVQAIELDQQITAKNWFLGYLQSNSYTLQGLKVFNNQKVEALYVLVEDAVSYVVRTTATINGPRMVLASYYLPEEAWMKERALQEYVLGSFRFLEPEQVKLQPTRTYTFLDLLRFDYPSSWRLLAPDINNIDSMNVRLVNSKDTKTLVGEINARIVSTELETSLPQELNLLKENIMSMGLEVGELLETPANYKFQPQVTFARVEVYNAKARSNNVQDHEYWLAVMAEDRYYYIISMLTPSRDNDFYNWASNTEAFQLIIESIRP